MATAIFLANNLQGARDSTALGLDAVENFKVTNTAKVSNHPVESGATVSDHYFLDPVTASFQGVVTPWNFTGKGTDFTPLEFIREVNSTMVARGVFDLFLSDDLQSIPSCVITKFEYDRAAKEGKSVIVNVDVQQVTIVQRAEEVNIESQALAPDVSEQGQSSVNEGDSVVKTSFLERAEAGVRIISAF